MFPLLAVGDGEALSVDPDSLDDDELAAVLVALHRSDAVRAAAKARLTASFDARRVWAADGSRTAAAWLSRHCRLPDEAARAEVRLARRLRTMPATAEALAGGEVTVHHARRLASLNRPEVADAFAEGEPLLVGQARLSWARFTRTTNYWLQLALPDQTEDDAAAQEENRRVHLSPGLDGTGLLDGPDRVMAVGTTRLFTGALRRAVEVRDRHCTHPGCTVPAARCDVDHIVPYNDGGPTTQTNGTLRCPAHHRWRHQQTGRTNDDDEPA